MSILFPATILVFITVRACVDNVLWRDRYGWTCRDYNRDPRECSSKLAVSEGGIDAYEACCSCEFSVERRRDYASCLRACSAEEDACEAECAADKASCEDTCNTQHESEDDPVGVTEEADPETPEPESSGSSGLEIWVIVLIVVGVLLLLYILCIIFYCLMMPQDEGTCPEDDCITQQPMLVGGGCDAPCDAPCDNQYDRAGEAQMVSYGETQAYPQRNGW